METFDFVLVPDFDFDLFKKNSIVWKRKLCIAAANLIACLRRTVLYGNYDSSSALENWEYN